MCESLRSLLNIVLVSCMFWSCAFQRSCSCSNADDPMLDNCGGGLSHQCTSVQNKLLEGATIQAERSHVLATTKNLFAEVDLKKNASGVQVTLVTGGCGFIGSHAVNLLLAEGHHVVVVDRMDICACPREIDSSYIDQYSVEVGDCSDAAFMIRVFQENNITDVFHFAAETHEDNSYIAPFRFIHSNVVGTQVLLECCVRVRMPKRFVHVSTDEVYGTTPDGIDACTEKDPLNPTNPYSASKVGAEAMVVGYGHSFDINWVMVRGNNAYGPGQYPEKVIPKWCIMTMNDEPLTLQGDGKQSRSFIFVEDFAQAVMAVYHSGEIANVYNIGGCREVNLLELAQRINEIAGHSGSPKFRRIPDRSFNDMRYIIDHSKITKLGWDVRVSFAEGLQKTFDYYKKNQAEPWCKSYVNGMKEIDVNQPQDSGKGLVWLVYGSKGWIGGQLCEELQKQCHTTISATARADCHEDVAAELETHQPDRVLCIVGRTHGPGCATIDWCEDHLKENVRDNMVAPMTLAILCSQRGIHLTYMGTGCIFSQPPNQVLNTSYTEEDKADFFGSGYSVVKGMTDNLMRLFHDNVLNVRIRMPISADFNERNFVTKIANYEKVVNVPNSMTVLHEAVPAMIDMAYQKRTGTINLVNPGTLSHNQVLKMYKEHVDPNKTWKNFSTEEQLKILKADRSNNQLDTTKLQKWCPGMSPATIACEEACKRMGCL